MYLDFAHALHQESDFGNYVNRLGYGYEFGGADTAGMNLFFNNSQVSSRTRWRIAVTESLSAGSSGDGEDVRECLTKLRRSAQMLRAHQG